MGTETKPVSLYLVDPLTKVATPVGNVDAIFSQADVSTSSSDKEWHATFLTTCHSQFVEEMRHAIEMLRCQPDGVEFVFYTYTQRRRHRKKRINKKWAKRYGFNVHEYRASGTLQQTII